MGKWRHRGANHSILHGLECLKWQYWQKLGKCYFKWRTRVYLISTWKQRNHENLSFVDWVVESSATVVRNGMDLHISWTTSCALEIISCLSHYNTICICLFTCINRNKIEFVDSNYLSAHIWQFAKAHIRHNLETIYIKPFKWFLRRFFSSSVLSLKEQRSGEGIWYVITFNKIRELFANRLLTVCKLH